MTRKGRPSPMRRMIQPGYSFLAKIKELSQAFLDATERAKRGPSAWQIGPGERDHHRRVVRTDGVTHNAGMDIYRDTLEKVSFRERLVRDQKVWRRGVFVGILKNFCYRSGWLPDGRKRYFQHCREVRRQRWALVMAGKGSAV